MKANTLLLVEDNHKLAAYLKDSLEEEGYQVAIEHRGDKAVYRILHEQPSLVILDIMLPGMNGDQICHTVRDEYSGKILMLTALNDIETEVTSLNLGADDYLSKPVADAVLKARIEALLRRPTLVTPQIEFQFSKFYINLNTKRVSLHHKEISLSSRDFELLALLVKNHDQLMNRDNISYALYGREYDGVDRGIDLKISRLRKSLNDEKAEKIKTIHGKGYVFIGDAWS